MVDERWRDSIPAIRSEACVTPRIGDSEWGTKPIWQWCRYARAYFSTQCQHSEQSGPHHAFGMASDGLCGNRSPRCRLILLAFVQLYAYGRHRRAFVAVAPCQPVHGEASLLLFGVWGPGRFNQLGLNHLGQASPSVLGLSLHSRLGRCGCLLTYEGMTGR